MLFRSRLAVVIDLFSRQVVGWSLREDMSSSIVIDALRMAWFKRHPGKRSTFNEPNSVSLQALSQQLPRRLHGFRNAGL